MKMIKLTAIPSLLLAFVFLLSSCVKDDVETRNFQYQKTGIVLSGAQETPANPSTALGSMDVTYRSDTKTLTYKVTWSGLTGPVAAMHIHGQAPSGFAAAVFQGFTVTGLLASGTYSGSLLIDGVAIKEENLLNGLYYWNIHTATYPGGEIRGQIRFQ
jgi:CHRD domain